MKFRSGCPTIEPEPEDVDVLVVELLVLFCEVVVPEPEVFCAMPRVPKLTVNKAESRIWCFLIKIPPMRYGQLLSQTAPLDKPVDISAISPSD